MKTSPPGVQNVSILSLWYKDICAKFEVCSSNSLQNMENEIFWWSSWNWKQHPLGSKIYWFCICDTVSIYGKCEVCSSNSLRDMENQIFWWPSWNWRQCPLGSKIYQFCLCHRRSICAKFQVYSSNSLWDMNNEIFLRTSRNRRQHPLIPKIQSLCVLLGVHPCVKFYYGRSNTFCSIVYTKNPDGVREWQNDGVMEWRPPLLMFSLLHRNKNKNLYPEMANWSCRITTWLEHWS